ncbi:MAG: EscU/YscU/HrcU family type III secretion system export apparatus switch protein [Candidatus Marinamargulisbacteria bacterium]
MKHRKDKIVKKRQALEKKIKRRMGELSNQDKENLQAIAIQYDQSSKKAPRIVASGRGKVAQKILTLAEENDIPMVEDSNLSKLLSSLKIKSEIPPKLFKVIAEILAFIFYLEKMAKKRAGLRSKFKRLKK